MRSCLRDILLLACSFCTLVYSAGVGHAEALAANNSLMAAAHLVGVAAATSASGAASSPASTAASMAGLAILRSHPAVLLTTSSLPPDAPGIEQPTLEYLMSDGRGLGIRGIPTGVDPLTGGARMGSMHSPQANSALRNRGNQGMGGGGGGYGSGGGRGGNALSGLRATGHPGGSLSGTGTLGSRGTGAGAGSTGTGSIANLKLTYFPHGIGSVPRPVTKPKK